MKFTTSRRTYERADLLEDAVAADPFAQLEQWLEEAFAAGIPDANAMCLATADRDSQPSARMVLLRGIDRRGLVFYTSYFSRKGRAIESNPMGAVLFYWPEFERQVRVEGALARVSEDESDEYFASRPKGHQLSAWASEQSEPVESRELLDQRMVDYEHRFEGDDVPRPHSWGGYRLEPARFEFWQGRPNRMHDRLEYVPHGRQWRIRRLQP
ncbi:MAG: pyridoxamine 5'-phosphate oxidase [Candidatus Eremiobacteraeota bacterium]|nr:pyridoxamine 5'-phosphate oxidase [Candidatus Eremiobacteraeota bacterium]